MQFIEAPPYRWPASPIQIPEGRAGDYRIAHRRVYRADLVSMREALLTGKRPVSVSFVKPLRVHELSYGGGVWMTDLPIELRQMADQLERMRPLGRVLVGGLGLGIVAQWLADWPGVEAVDVVEIAPEIIRLVAPEIRRHPFRVVEADVKAYIDGLERWPYDFVYLDTWQATGEGSWWDNVFPLRRLIGQRFGAQRIHAWAEDIMLGQVRGAIGRVGKPMQPPMSAEDEAEMRRLAEIAGPEALASAERMIEASHTLIPPHWKYAGLPAAGLSEVEILDLTGGAIGTPAWEGRWADKLREE